MKEIEKWKGIDFNTERGVVRISRINYARYCCMYINEIMPKYYKMLEDLKDKVPEVFVLYLIKKTYEEKCEIEGIKDDSYTSQSFRTAIDECKEVEKNKNKIKIILMSDNKV